MNKTILSVVLGFIFGLPAIGVFIAAGELIETPGAASTALSFLVASVATAAYLGYCEFWVAPRGAPGIAPKVPTIAATATPLVLSLTLFDSAHAALATGLPLVAAGVAGGLLGGVIADRVLVPAQVADPVHTDAVLARCGRRIAAAVALIAAATTALVAAATRPSPSGSAAAPWIMAAFNLVGAAPLVFGTLGTRGAERFSAAVLGFPAVLGLFLGAIMLIPACVCASYGAGMALVSLLLFACSVCNLAATGVLTSAYVSASRALPPGA